MKITLSRVRQVVMTAALVAGTVYAIAAPYGHGS